MKKLDYNWAKDQEFASKIMADLTSVFKRVQDQRAGRELVWQKSYRMWSVDTSGVDQSYQGMAEIQIPQIRKEVETMSRRLYKGLMPEDYLKGEATGSGFVSQDLINVNTQVVRHYYDNVMKVKRSLYPWVKQNVLYGTSPLRQFWDKKTNEMFYKKRVGYADSSGIIRFKTQVVQEDVVLYNAPKLRAEDIFNTWIYPVNALLQEDIEMVFFRTFVKKFDLEVKAKEGTCIGFDQIKDMGGSVTQDFSEAQERLQQMGDSGEKLSIQGNDNYELLEIWCNLLLPGSDRPVSCVVEIVQNAVCTRIQRNPYWHQQIPFDFGRFILPPPGEFYGRGLPEAVLSLQTQLVDTMNQTMDATTLSLNNITIINPAYAQNDESFEIEPGAKWWADPDSVKQMSFPDLSESGYKAAGVLRGWISELSDNQPQLPDPIAGKARSTGQAQLAVNEWQTDLFCFIDFLSVEALSSMAHKTHSLLQQFLSEEDIIRVTGKYAGTMLDRVVTPEDIVGRYKFTWIGALQIENQSIKTQQLLNLLSLWKNLPPEAQSQIRMRWENFMVKVLRDGMQVKDVENVIETEHLRSAVSPSIEERILTLGGDIEVNPSDEDEVHIRIHEQAIAKDKDPVTKTKRSQHILEHKAAMQKKVQAAKMIALMQEQAMLQAPKGSEGNTTQIPEATSEQNIQRGMRVGAGQA